MSEQKIKTPRPPSARQVERVLGAETLAALLHHAQTSTEWMERLGGQLVNHTLQVWSGQIPASGVLEFSFGVAAGSVYVRNLGDLAGGGNPMTVSSAGPSGAGVPRGIGTAIVLPTQAETIPLASRQFAIYGTATEWVWWAAFTAPVRPSTA